MAIILNDPEDIVATVHHNAELILCNGCTKEWKEKHSHMILFMSFTPIKARITGIHEKCDGCHSNLLNMEF